MKRIVFLLLLLFPFFSWGVSLLPQEKKETPQVPNPVDLKINWWEYYNVDSKTLLERRQVTQEYFAKISEGLTEDQYEKAQPYFNQILSGLQFLADLKGKEAPTVPPPTLAKESKKISYQDWIGLSTKMLEQTEELQYLSLRLELARSSYKSGGKYVDTRYAAYLKQESTDPGRFQDGLIIMQGRIYQAIEKLQLSNLQELVDDKKKSIAILQDEVESAYRMIDYGSITFEQIENSLSAARDKEKQSHNSYILSYERSPLVSINVASEDPQERELSDQNLLNAKLDYEISRVDVINLEIQKIIVGWEKKKEHLSSGKIREKMEEWKTIVNEVQGEIQSSENSSELILQQSLKSLALQTDGSGQSFPTDRSLELSELAILKIEQLKNSLFVNQFLMDQLIQIKREFHFDFFDRVTVTWDSLLAFFKTDGNWFQQSLFKIGEFPVTPIGLIKFIVIIIIAYILGRLARHFINYFGKKQNRIKITSIYILSRVSYYVIVVIGIIIAGSAIGLDLTLFAYVAGALAIWVGFGLQSIFHNFISGIIVLLTKTLKINDIVELDTGEIGTVSDLNIRTTVVRTFDGKDFVIPNADIVNKKYLNHTLSSHTLRVKVPFRIGIDEDKRRIAKIVIEAAKRVEITSDVNEPEIWMNGYGDNFIHMELVVWINTFLRGKTASRISQYYWAIDDAFKENRITIPVPMQDIQLRRWEEPPQKPFTVEPPPEPKRPESQMPPPPSPESGETPFTT